MDGRRGKQDTKDDGGGKYDYAHLKKIVQRQLAKIKRQSEIEEYEQLCSYLHHKRDCVVQNFVNHGLQEDVPGEHMDECPIERHLWQQQQQQQQQQQPLSKVKTVNDPPPNQMKRKRASAASMFTVRVNKTTKQSVPKIPISTQGDKLPGHSSTIPIRQSFAAEDEVNLLFVPPLSYNDEDTGDVLSMFDTTYRQNLMEHGAECQQEQTNAKIDAMIHSLLLQITVPDTNANNNNNDKEQLREVPTDLMLQTIAAAMVESVARIQTRYDILTASGSHTNADSTPNIANNDGTAPDADAAVPVADAAFEEVASSCRDMWCRRCYTYDCNLHGQREKPSLEAQFEISLRKEQDGFWKKKSSSSTQTRSLDSPSEHHFGQDSELTDDQKSICNILFSIFDGDVNPMAWIARASPSTLQEHIRLHEISGIVPTNHLPKASKNVANYFSIRNYKTSWYHNHRDAEIYPFFFPCYHDGICDDDNCSCVSCRVFCTKACGLSNNSPNFFRGCDCKGYCRSDKCTCFAGNRECDPNICKCTTCTDPDGQPHSTQRCRNDNILMNRGPSLLIGKSVIPEAGWGLFCRRHLKQGDFVGEYVGEAISQEEADRRGLIADAKDCSYIFMIASDLNLDSSRKGNNTRFINHSDNPNLEQKIMFVKGEQRIGFFACQDIQAQSELFFNYRYKQTMDNKLLLQIPISEVKWMEKQRQLTASS